MKGVRLNKLFHTSYIVVNYKGKYALKNCSDWIAITSNNEICCNDKNEILFWSTKAAAEAVGDIFCKNKIPLSCLKGVDNLINFEKDID